MFAVIAVVAGVALPTPGEASSARDVELVVLEFHGGVPDVRTETVSVTRASALLAGADPSVVASPASITYRPLSTGSDPVRDLQWQLAAVGAPDVWAGGIDGSGVTIGIVDTGVMTDDVVVDQNANFTGDATNDFAHGTQVASTAASIRDNGIGGAGVAPGAHVVQAKVCSQNSCDIDAVVRGLIWAVQSGADIVNMSLGAGADAAVFDLAVRWALDQGVTVIAAAGNSSCSIDDVANCNPDFDNVNYPAAYPGVVAVTAVDATGTSPSFTSKGRRSTIAAPGVDVWFSTNGLFGSYASGTSFASPVVAGVAALTTQAAPSLAPKERMAALMLSASPATAPLIRPLPRAWYYGAGIVNAPAAVEWATTLAAASVPAPTVVPSAGTLQVSWTAVPATTGYTVTVAPGTTTVYDSATTTATFGGLENGRTYALDVVAHTPSGDVISHATTAIPAATLGAVSLTSVDTSSGTIAASVALPPGDPVLVEASLNGVPLGTSSVSSGSAAQFVPAGPVTGGDFEIWFVDHAGASGPHTHATVTLPAMLSPPTNLHSVREADGSTTLSWDPSIYHTTGGTGDGTTADSYLVYAVGWDYETRTVDDRDVRGVTATSLNLHLRDGIPYTVRVTGWRDVPGFQSVTSSMTVMPLPAHPAAPAHLVVSPGPSTTTVSFDTLPADQRVTITSTGNYPFDLAFPTDTGTGRSYVTIANQALGLHAGVAARLCLAAARYFPAGGWQDFGPWSSGVSFWPDGPDTASDGDLCTTINPPVGPAPSTTTTTTTTMPVPTTTPAPSSSQPTATTAPSTPVPTSIGPTAAAGRFTPIVPQRLLDTRTSPTTTRLAAHGIARIQVAGTPGVEMTADAVIVNVAAVNPAAAGFVTVWPCDTPQPFVAALTYTRGGVESNAAFAGLGSGALCVYSLAATDLVVDLTGYFVGAAHAYTPMSPTRLADTRDSHQRLGAGTVLDVGVAGGPGIPADATAVTLNVTAVDPAADGFVTVWPCDQPRPTTASLTVAAHDTRPNLVVAKLSAGGHVCAYSLQATDLVIDANGWWSSAGAVYRSVAPYRLIDTREQAGPLAAGTVLRLHVTGTHGVPAGAVAIAANITVINPTAAGFVTAWPCGDRPLASSGNYRAGDIRPNAVAVAVSADGDVCVSSYATTDIAIDVTGQWE